MRLVPISMATMTGILFGGDSYVSKFMFVLSASLIDMVNDQVDGRPKLRLHMTALAAMLSFQVIYVALSSLLARRSSMLL